ncbi:MULTISPECIES: RNA 2',3'-cyclic phosphodiesterase [Acidobacterium]|uniref:RNA 2',3'-cyclic phosphodiesterase n=1 Tax=Acidobacterium capsulatum (strain ATCC 51196 / DSM 11244 / BCRC 80197 / JCM 7670 / NBRC 15755 / NCIMB 13165 / 161) TaxID=240015 RepID=C1F3J7_ACIC5|nr:MULTISPECIES: RNA 2',3'-cyclic phosphodiesterase [Acidobacterium]ACO33106.1 2'-5' RNA ligase [Acidobacterium capsulatum ATCC 51196]HCT60221.1 RNA 2',3'-cyclic phosphodiesterase [Acidobacterium sp.]
MKRLFTGIAIPAAEVPELLECSEALAAQHGQLRWSERNGWHVTLQFYGMVTTAQEACLRQALAQVRGSLSSLQIRGIGFFERAGVLLAEVQPNADLDALQRAVVKVSRACGFLPEERPYHPHVTLARRRSRRDQAEWQEILSRTLPHFQEHPSGSVKVSEFVLYESVPGPAGSRYEVMERFLLRG